MQFSTKIDGFEQNDSQGFENSYNSYEQYPLEKFFIFTIYQNYTLALIILVHIKHVVFFFFFFFFLGGGGFGGHLPKTCRQIMCRTRNKDVFLFLGPMPIRKGIYQVSQKKLTPLNSLPIKRCEIWNIFRKCSYAWTVEGLVYQNDTNK